MEHELALENYPYWAHPVLSNQLVDSNSFNPPILGAAFKISVLQMRKPRPKGKITFPEYLPRIRDLSVMGVQQLSWMEWLNLYCFYSNQVFQLLMFWISCSCGLWGRDRPGPLGIFSALCEYWLALNLPCLHCMWGLLAVSQAEDRIQKSRHCLMSPPERETAFPTVESHRVDLKHLESRLDATTLSQGSVPS